MMSQTHRNRNKRNNRLRQNAVRIVAQASAAERIDVKPLGARSTPLERPEPQRLRLTLSCDCDGCRKSMTPPTVCVPGPSVYLGAARTARCRTEFEALMDSRIGRRCDRSGAVNQTSA